MSSPKQPPDTAPGGLASDQSMEDILASIRRILNEDEAPAAEPAADTPAAAEPFVLTEEMMVTAPEEPASVAMAPPPEVAAPEPPHVAASETLPAPAAEALTPPATDALLAPAAAAAATAAVGQLLRAVSSERGATVTRGGPSIEDVVREEMRPLLKDWLDQHLPPLVERLVRAEIERLVGRALS
ncbi:DUF2497 domain-containing protein [Neoroseomonas soli]|uniref:DUF2497 domain-containing protein n=1 Tax=Neoroseomonas soli TaxID=1081025 RepID=A0A9X9WVK4_9PROT|nr:DUF2497 domain-containing protein [Neoroseomonas soli]MBR0671183.1 DUF2497 domain-containing protein [Neoroseomonas soli]